MRSSAPVEPAIRIASSNAHSDAVEKSVGIRMRRQGYTTLLRGHLLAACARRDDVANHGLRRSLGLRNLQRDLPGARLERIARNERVLHRLIQLHFQRPPVLRRRKWR